MKAAEEGMIYEFIVLSLGLLRHAHAYFGVFFCVLAVADRVPVNAVALNQPKKQAIAGVPQPAKVKMLATLSGSRTGTHVISK